jgi:pimeloyl-ACP methyl ester carboxylesterase
MLRTAILVSTMAAAVTVPAAGAESAPLKWGPCKENAEVECAILQVPIDWARGGKTIGIQLARRPASDRAKRIGTLVYLPGGPGDSGVSQLTQGLRTTPEVQARFDVVSLDPRGTNRSSPVKCAAGPVPSVDPDTGVKFADVLAYSKNAAESCRAGTGELIDHLDSVSVAQDVDAIRAALGERQISLYSRSYGTLAAQMYAERYPQRTRAVTLDSVFDHSLGTEEFLASETRAVEDAFTAFATWCDGSANCALHGQDVRAVVAEYQRKAERGELFRPGSSTRISQFEFATVLASHFYGPSWVQLADLLARFDKWPSRAVPVEATAIFCADHRFAFRSGQDWVNQWDRLKRLAPHMRSHLGWQLVSLCAGWPVVPANPQHRPDIHVPVLLLNSRHDGANGLEWAVHVSRTIPRSVLVTYEGAGHGVYDRNDCTRSVTDGYLIDRTMPARGTRCAGSDPQ